MFPLLLLILVNDLSRKDPHTNELPTGRGLSFHDEQVLSTKTSNAKKSEGEKNVPVPRSNPLERNLLMEFLDGWQTDGSMTMTTSYKNRSLASRSLGSKQSLDGVQHLSSFLIDLERIDSYSVQDVPTGAL